MKFLTVAALGLAVAPALVHAQVSFVRASATFIATDRFSPNSTGVDYFPTDEARFTNTISYADFRTQLANAYAQGLGGVVDFEAPSFGDSLRDLNRTNIFPYVYETLTATPPPPGGDNQAAFDAARAVAYATPALFNPAGAPIRVENRNDRQRLADPIVEPNTDIAFDRMVVRYGIGSRNALEIRRGPQIRQEGELATLTAPGAENIANSRTINDHYFLGIGTQGANVAATSGISFLAGRASNKDFAFDPRDNVQVVAFSLLSFNNFQFWQGLGSAAANPDNARVIATFSDGSRSVYAGTTQQIAGRNQMFFGIRAPAGQSIARVLVWVRGNNFRTFSNIDDLAFITGPAAPYVASSLQVAGSAGVPFFYALETRKEPTSVTVTGLPAGLSYDSATGIISGTPASVGTTNVAVQLVNAAGTRNESLSIAIAATPNSGDVPLFGTITAPPAILGRAITPINLDSAITVSAGARSGLRYFTVARRADTNALTTLEAMGLGLADGQITGTPRQAGQVGRYNVTAYAMGPTGGTSTTFQISIFPPVPPPNFDGAAGDTVTDLAFLTPTRDLRVLLGSSYFDGTTFARRNQNFITVASALPADAQIFLGDFDGNNSTDFLTLVPGTGDFVLHTLNAAGTGFSATPIFDGGHNTPWRILAAADFDGTGRDGLLLQDNRNQGLALWRLSGAVITWAGYLINDGVSRTLVNTGDFDGDGRIEFLFRRNDTTYQLLKVVELRPTGVIPTRGDTFTVPANLRPHLVGDLDGDGKSDLVWKNTQTGAFSAWLMADVVVPAAARADATATVSPVVATGGPVFVPAGSTRELVSLGTFNSDRPNDLLAQDRASRQVLAVLMSGLNRLPIGGTPELMLDGVTPVPQATRIPETGVLSTASTRKNVFQLGVELGGNFQAALLSDEALVDYTVYQQMVSNGAPVWLVEGFFARPSPDLARPVAAEGRNRSVWLDSFLRPGEALRDYSIYQRSGSNPDGTPRPLVNRFPVPKNVVQPVPLSGSVDNRWTPVAPTAPGVDFDYRGRRGFLPALDLFGVPLVDAGGNPVYVRWSGNTAIVEGGANVPWEFDYNQNVGAVVGQVLPAGNDLTVASTGDYNGDGKMDVLTLRNTDGLVRLIAQDGAVSGTTVDLTGLPTPIRVLSPRAVTPDLVAPRSAFTGWLEAKARERGVASVAAGEDPDGNGLSYLEEYAMGYQAIAQGQAPVRAKWERATTGGQLAPRQGSDDDGILLTFYLRHDDAGLGAVVETSADMVTWQTASYEAVATETVSPNYARVTWRVRTSSQEAQKFLRLRLASAF